jgi:hypothetical protein
LIQQGLRLRRAGDDAAALPLFERAYALHPTARAAAQVGFAEQALGRFADAEKHVSEALQATNDPWIRKYRPTIEQALVTIKGGVCTVEVIAEPPGASIRLNGRTEGVAPLPGPLRVTQGTAHLEVSAPGFHPIERNLALRGGGYESVVIRLKPDTAVRPPAAETQARPVATQLPQRSVRETDMHEPKTNWWRLAGWGAFAAAGVGLTLGTVEFLDYRSKVQEFNGKRDATGQKRCFDDGTSIFGPEASAPADDCRELASQYRSAKKWSIAGFVAGGALLGSAIVITVMTSPTTEPKTALACGVQVGGSIVCQGRF